MSIATAGPRLNNLPIALSAFVGREHESAEIQHLLTPTPNPSPSPDALGRERGRGGEAGEGVRAAPTRLLTLTGPGGCSKMRLALCVAQIVHLQSHHALFILDIGFDSRVQMSMRAQDTGLA